MPSGVTAPSFGSLRRALTERGGFAANVAWTDLPVAGEHAPPAVDVLELPFRHHDVGPPMPWDEDVAFLDGMQHLELIGNLGTDPVIAAVVRAAIRVRHDRRTTASVTREQRIVIARPHVLAALRDTLAGFDVVAIDGDAESRHPVRDLERAHAAVDDARAALEASVVRAFRVTSQCWIIADGTLAVSPDWTADRRMVGVVKTHGTIPLEGEMLDTWLTLPAGCRTSVYRPRSQRVTPLQAWGLRLWPFAGHHLFHGLVRIETAASDDSLALADPISRFLLAEKAPLAASPRADRLLYGIHDVARYLRSRGVDR